MPFSFLSYGFVLIENIVMKHSQDKKHWANLPSFMYLARGNQINPLSTTFFSVNLLDCRRNKMVPWVLQAGLHQIQWLEQDRTKGPRKGPRKERLENRVVLKRKY